MATTDDFKIGTSNLNNTPENSAKIGDTLLNPEIGWKRYDDTSDKIKYSSKCLITTGNPNPYKATYHTSGDNMSLSESMEFKFYGSKLRILSSVDYSRSKNVCIKIDDTVYRYDNGNEASSDKCVYTVIVFEKLDLNLDVHKVKIYADENTIKDILYKGYVFEIDAIDTDGYLVESSELGSEKLATLIINLTDGETKVFDVSNSEIDKFKSWYNNKLEFENKLTYVFNKTLNSNISVEEDVVHDQITSYEIRKY